MRCSQDGQSVIMHPTCKGLRLLIPNRPSQDTNQFKGEENHFILILYTFPVQPSGTQLLELYFTAKPI
jgi:hypothetical protein